MLSAPTELDGQTAIVTGAGSGIGQATAHRFATMGANVVLAGRDQDRLEAVRSEIEAAGGTASAQPADVRVQADVAELVRVATGTYGRIDIVCNNAGVAGPRRPTRTWEFTDDEWDRLFETNLRSAFFMARHAVPALIESKGRIVNVSSMSGIVASGTAVYGVTKAALIHLTRGLAVELAPFGVRVNCVCPGAVITPFGKDLERPQSRAQYDTAVPLGRRAEATEVADAIAFLASARSSYATGAALVLDGGFSVV